MSTFEAARQTDQAGPATAVPQLEAYPLPPPRFARVLSPPYPTPNIPIDVRTAATTYSISSDTAEAQQCKRAAPAPADGPQIWFVPPPPVTPEQGASDRAVSVPPFYLCARLVRGGSVVRDASAEFGLSYVLASTDITRTISRVGGTSVTPEGLWVSYTYLEAQPGTQMTIAATLREPDGTTSVARTAYNLPPDAAVRVPSEAACVKSAPPLVEGAQFWLIPRPGSNNADWQVCARLTVNGVPSPGFGEVETLYMTAQGLRTSVVNLWVPDTGTGEPLPLSFENPLPNRMIKVRGWLQPQTGGRPFTAESEYVQIGEASARPGLPPAYP